MVKAESQGIADLVTDEDVLEIVLSLSRAFPEGDELSIGVNFLVGRAHSAFVAALSRDAETLDISPARIALVRQLYFSEGHRLSMSVLGERLAVTPGNITRLVSGLVAQGYIRRDTPESNRRSTFAELTPEGIRAFESTMPIILRASKRRLSVLEPAEKQVLITLLAKLRRALLTRSE